MEQALQRASSEAELLDQARRRDRRAIKQIIQTHNRRLYRIARGIVRHDSDAEDALQEAYIRAFNNLDAFRGEAPFGAWLARIVINESLALLRRRKPTVDIDRVAEEPALAAEIIPFPNAAGEPDPEAFVARRQIRILLEKAIDALPEAFRATLIARLVEGMSVEETAELFDIAPDTVKTRVHRARRLLQREMERRIGPTLEDTFPFAGKRCERLTERVLARLGLA